MPKTLAEKFEFDVRADVAKMLLDSIGEVPANLPPYKRASQLRSKVDNYTIAALDFYLLGLPAEAGKIAAQAN